MGGMHTWIWGIAHPDFMDALVPMASQPTEMSSRNWMMRRLIIDAIRNDPDWNEAATTRASRARFQAAAVFYGIATSGGTLAFQKQAPTRELADKLLDGRLAAPSKADANDTSISGTPRATTTPRPAWSASRPRCWPSIRPTTSATRRRPVSWSAS